MLIILEGMDKSGKSFIADRLHECLRGSLIIRKTYDKRLYPIDYGTASEFDWQTLFDRLILANPDNVFIADRSFFTQTVYQLCLGQGSHAITDAQLAKYNAYCAVLTSIPHLVIYCESDRFELDSMVVSKTIRNRINSKYLTMFRSIQGLNFIRLKTNDMSLYDNLQVIISKLKELQ